MHKISFSNILSTRWNISIYAFNKKRGGGVRIQNEFNRGSALNPIWQYFHTKERSDVRLLKQIVKMKAPSKRTLHEVYDKSIMYWCIQNARRRSLQLEFKFCRKRNWVMDLYRMSEMCFKCSCLLAIWKYKVYYFTKAILWL